MFLKDHTVEVRVSLKDGWRVDVIVFCICLQVLYYVPIGCKTSGNVGSILTPRTRNEALVDVEGDVEIFDASHLGVEFRVGRLCESLPTLESLHALTDVLFRHALDTLRDPLSLFLNSLSLVVHRNVIGVFRRSDELQTSGTQDLSRHSKPRNLNIHFVLDSIKATSWLNRFFSELAYNFRCLFRKRDTGVALSLEVYFVRVIYPSSEVLNSIS